MNLKYEVGQSVTVEHTELIPSTFRENATIYGVTIGKDGIAKYITSKGVFTESSLDAFGQPIKGLAPAPPTQPEPQEDKPKYEYKSGDRVKAISIVDGNDLINKIGTIKRLSGRCAWVCFDENIKGWKDDNANIPDGHGWSVYIEDLEPYAEPEQQPIRLYCVESYDKYGKRWITSGKTYEIDSKGFFQTDFGKDHGVSAVGGYHSWEDFQNTNPELSSRLVPLVSRPAKVGEWILITDSGTPKFIGTLAKVIEVYSKSLRVNHKQIVWYSNQPDGSENTLFYTDDNKYEVLDGYQPEPEYYNGKVLCYNNSNYGGNSGVASFYQGKVYEVKDGFLTDEQGTKRPMCKDEAFHSFEELNKRYSNSFKEHKGEAQ